MSKQRAIIERRKPVKVFFPITRILRGEEAGHPIRVVEGYTYVNAWVGDGWNLKRSAMVGASDDYMRWGAVREMHQPSAVGTATGSAIVDGETLALGVVWDANGAFLRSKIVDSDAIVKLDAGVYKGYSVGVQATVMRGTDVESCTWLENSLVDRPADPDAVFTLIRAEGADLNKPGEVVRYWDAVEYTVTPQTFGQMREDLAEDDLYDDLYMAFSAFMSSIESILMCDVADPAAMIRQSMQEFSAYMLSDILPEAAEGIDQGDTMTEEQRTAKALLIRAARDRWQGLTRAASALPAASNELAVERANLATATAAQEGLTRDLAAARERIAVLERQPDPTQPRPIRSAQPGIPPAQEQQFWANQGAAPNEEAVALRAEFDTLKRTLKDIPDDKARLAGVHRMQMIKAQLHEMGEAIS